jgi:hypothetical protein
MRSASTDWSKALSTAAFAASALCALFALATWRDLANGVRAGSPWNNVYGLTPLFEGGMQTGAVLGALLLNLAALLIGYWLVINPLWGHRRLASTPWLLLAGAIPGMLLLVAATRIVTLLVPNAFAPAILLTATAGATVLALLRLVPSPAGGSLASIRWSLVWPAALALLFALVFTVHSDQFRVVGEGSVWFIDHVILSEAHGIGSTGRWPLFPQHYDEATFLYPVVYGLMRRSGDAGSTLTVIYWLTVAFGRVGIASLTYLAMRALGVDRLSALVLLAFVCGASLSINPVSSRLLFDSLSPLGYALHVARFIVPVLPLLLVAAAPAATREPTVTSLSIAILLGVGLSSIPIHVGLVLLWAVGVLVLTAISPAASRSVLVWRAACLAGLLVLPAIAIAYGVQSLAASIRVGVLLAAAVVSSGLMAWALLSDRTGAGIPHDSVRPSSLFLAAACGGFAVGILLLGNVPIGQMYPVLSTTWPWHGLAVVERTASTLGTSSWELMQSPFCNGYGWAYRVLAGHCSSLPMLMRTYGLAFVAMLLVIAWWLRRWPRSHAIPDHLLTMLLWGIVLSLLAMVIGLVLFDFLSPISSDRYSRQALSIWLRSRLLEPWFYGGTLLALALFLREAGARERRWAQSAMMVGVAVFALSPLELPSQLVANTLFLLAALVGN